MAEVTSGIFPFFFLQCLSFMFGKINEKYCLYAYRKKHKHLENNSSMGLLPQPDKNMVSLGLVVV